MSSIIRNIVLTSLATLLVACGGDDNSSVPPPTSETSVEDSKIWGTQPVFSMKGKHFNLYWNEGSGFYFVEGGMVVQAPSSKPIIISGDEVLRWLDQNHGGESIKNQYMKMFKPGNFSEFDAIIYAMENRQDEICQRWGKDFGCRLEFDYRWVPERRTFQLTINGEKNWVSGRDYDGGDETAANNWGLEYIGNFRADEVLVKNKMNIGFAPIDETELAHYHKAQLDEIQRLEANNGKLIIPEIHVQTGMRLNQYISFEKRFIKTYNRQNPYGSIFTEVESEAQLDDNNKPMTHTGFVDEDGNFVSCGIEGFLCWDYTPSYIIRNVEVKPHNLRPDYYYDGIITMADVALSLNDVPGHSGSLILWPSLDTNTNVDTYAINDIDGLYSSGFYGWNYNWTDSAMHERMGTSPWDYSPHIVGDMAILASPDLIVFQYADFYRSYYEVQEFTVGDENDPYRNTRHHVLDPKSPLTPEHFGWGVANCGLCHSGQDMDYDTHQGLATEDELVEPAQCAECHGNNGAKLGHDQKSGCYRCHRDMVGHGDANTANRTAHPFEKHGIGLSKTLPDPYACASCHANKNDVLVGGK